MVFINIFHRFFKLIFFQNIEILIRKDIYRVNMKRSVGILFLMTFLVLSSGFVSAGWFSDAWDKITGRAVSNTGYGEVNETIPLCIDSDGGLNLYEQGKLVGYHSVYGGVELEDFCVDRTESTNGEIVSECSGSKCELGERVCTGYTPGDYVTRYYNCPNGCVDGACVQEKENCESLVEDEGFLFFNISDYSVISAAPGSDNISQVYYYSPKGNLDSDKYLIIAFNVLNQSRFEEYNNFISSNNVSISYYNGNNYYAFSLDNSDDDIKRYLTYPRGNIFISAILVSNNSVSSSEAAIANGAIERYINVCSPSFIEGCNSQWSNGGVEPAICPDSGIQEIIWKDLNGCSGSYTEKVVCVPKDCEDCNLDKVCDGCDIDGKCYPIGYRVNIKTGYGVSNNYCDIGGYLYLQKSESESCVNDFECSTNICVNGSCIDASVWERFMNWFKAIFGANLIGGLYE